MTVPVVTGHPDMTVIDQVIQLVLAAAGHGAGDRASVGAGGTGRGDGGTASLPLDIGYTRWFPSEPPTLCHQARRRATGSARLYSDGSMYRLTLQPELSGGGTLNAGKRP
jgi:hypothetical protein